MKLHYYNFRLEETLRRSTLKNTWKDIKQVL